LICEGRLVRLPLLAAALVIFGLLAAGCDGRTPAPAAASENSGFSSDELAAMKKSVRTKAQFKELVKIKALERDGNATVKYPADKRRSGKG
jgi:hypothetical protein